MAIYNEIMSPRFSRAIQKYFQMKGPQAVKSVAGDLTIALPLFWGREARALEGWKTGAGRVALAAGGAGNIGQGQIRNPAGSNIIAVVEKITVSLGAADQAVFSFTSQTSADAAIGGSIVTMDSRFGTTNALPNLMTCNVTGKNNSAALVGTVFGSINVGANVPYDYIITDIQELPLLPDSVIYVAGLTANETVLIDFLWRERFMEESERTL